LDACKPKVELIATSRSLPTQVTPVHIKEAAEKMKADNRPVHNYAQMAPAELAQAVAGVHGDATYLGDLVGKYANSVQQPALRSKLNNDKERLSDAKQELVRVCFDAAPALVSVSCMTFFFFCCCCCWIVT
jgi:hypothetical protein